METTSYVVAAAIGILSVQPALNLVSSRQIMNTSFDSLDLVNTYGAFGSVGRERLNVVFEGTTAEHPDDDADWKPYPYKGLPEALDRMPPQVAPYQLRLDWQMWFAAMSGPREYPWTSTRPKLLTTIPSRSACSATILSCRAAACVRAVSAIVSRNRTVAVVDARTAIAVAATDLVQDGAARLHRTSRMARRGSASGPPGSLPPRLNDRRYRAQS